MSDARYSRALEDESSRATVNSDSCGFKRFDFSVEIKACKMDAAARASPGTAEKKSSGIDDLASGGRTEKTE